MAEDAAASARYARRMVRYFAALLVAAVFAGMLLAFSGYTIEFTWDDGPGVRLVQP